MAKNDLSQTSELENRHLKKKLSNLQSNLESNGEKLTVKFWGVRGSYPVPGPTTLKYGGNTSCVEIRTKNHRIILDSGTGLIPLGDAIMAEHSTRVKHSTPLNLTILLSHTHHDHIQALPFFVPAYSSETLLHIFGPQLLGVDLRETISQMMEARYCPVNLDELNSNIMIRSLADMDRLLFRDSMPIPVVYHAQQKMPPLEREDFVVTIMRSHAHPKDGVFVFKMTYKNNSVVYATDVEGYAGGDSRLIHFSQKADLLIHDAQYTKQEYSDTQLPKQGFGHSTIDMACKVARKANVEKLVLFHHDPRHDDKYIDEMQAHARNIFNNTYAAYEGMEIDLG